MNAALAGLVVLIVGDSHIASLGFFNNPLHEALLAQGAAAVHSYGVCNSTAEDWTRPLNNSCGAGERHNNDAVRMAAGGAPLPWAISDLVGRYHPDLVIVELGDTMAGYVSTPALPREEITGEVRLLTSAINAKNVPCIWIGPPWGTEGTSYKKTVARVQEVSDLLAHSVAPCRYVDSLALSRPGEWTTRDGVHLTVSSNSLWAARLTASLVQVAPEVRKH